MNAKITETLSAKIAAFRISASVTTWPVGCVLERIDPIKSFIMGLSYHGPRRFQDLIGEALLQCGLLRRTQTRQPRKYPARLRVQRSFLHSRADGIPVNDFIDRRHQKAEAQ